jgi:LuxR family maltose regulon positive regulatory protein
LELCNNAVRIIHVLHLDAQGLVQEAVAELRSLLTIVERTGYVRIILDLSHRLNSLLLRINTPFAEELLQRGKSTLHNASFDLSPTELRVLQYLAGTLSTTAIAAEMFISVTTVRTHVRSIYRKMRVNARKVAVIVARNAGLVN